LWSSSSVEGGGGGFLSTPQHAWGHPARCSEGAVNPFALRQKQRERDAEHSLPSKVKVTAGNGGKLRYRTYVSLLNSSLIMNSGPVNVAVVITEEFPEKLLAFQPVISARCAVSCQYDC
jgi:hypothetical protein